MGAQMKKPCFELSLVLEVFAARWKAEILWYLRQKPMRFNELRRQVGASQKVLADQLRAMERDGLVQRRQLAGASLHVEYSSTALCATLYPILEEVYQWWSANWPLVEQARQRREPKSKEESGQEFIPEEG
jgi:DNA-binding HxlR family transcriptional regulator